MELTLQKQDFRDNSYQRYTRNVIYFNVISKILVITTFLNAKFYEDEKMTFTKNYSYFDRNCMLEFPLTF
jgi:hypothetical protein